MLFRNPSIKREVGQSLPMSSMCATENFPMGFITYLHVMKAYGGLPLDGQRMSHISEAAMLMRAVMHGVC